MILMFPSIDFGAFTSDDPENMATTLQLVALMTVLSLAPAILILMTSFTRIVIVLSFVRMGLATQQMPPNQVLISLALFMTFFIMAPVFSDINESALTPMLDGEMTQEEAFTEGTEPLKEFMSQHTREKTWPCLWGMPDWNGRKHLKMFLSPL